MRDVRRALPVLALVGLIVGVPLAALVRVATGDGLAGLSRALGSPAAGTAVGHTVAVALAVTGLAVAGGTALALGIERRPARSRRLGRLLVATPLVVPEFVLGFAWTQAYGPAGLSDRLLGVTIPGLFGPTGIVLVLTVHALPLAYLAVAAGLAVRADPDLERAARAAGAGRWTVLRTITLPLLRVPLFAAAALVFVSAVNSFGIPQVLGVPAGFATMSTLVYTNLVLSADPTAFTDLTVVALAMVVLVLVALGPLDLWLGGLGRSARHRAPSTVDNRRAGRAVAGTIAGLVGFGVVVPMVTVLLAALTRGPGLPPVPRNWTLANFSAAFAGGTGAALARSVWLAAAAAALAPLLGGAVAALSRGPWRGPLATAVTLAFAIPGSALAVGILIGYGRWLAGSALLILVAYLAKFWALAHRPAQAALDRLSPDLVAAARASGAGPATAWRTVVLPPLATALAAGAVLVFVFAFHELTMSTILYGPGSETFGVVILNHRDLGSTGTTAALAVVQSAPVALIALLLLRLRPGAG